MFLSAVGQRLSSPDSLWRIVPEGDGAEGLTEDGLKAARSQRMKEEKRVLDLMLRSPSASGLSAETLCELGRWERVFNLEVHGSLLTRGSTIRQIGEHKGLSLWPIPERGRATMYLSLARDISWMLTRTLPLLQARAGAFGSDWSNRWAVLDESFRYETEQIGESGKKIAHAMIELIDKKFRFTADTFYGQVTRRNGTTDE